MAFKRIVAKSENDLETIIDNIKSWFQESEDYNTEFTKENRIFQDPNTLERIEKSIDVIKAVDKNNGNVASIKFNVVIYYFFKDVVLICYFYAYSNADL